MPLTAAASHRAATTVTVRLATTSWRTRKRLRRWLDHASTMIRTVQHTTAAARQPIAAKGPMAPARNLMPSSSRLQSSAGSNGRPRIPRKPTSSSFIKASRPRATPNSVAIAGRARTGERSSTATPRSASSGTLTKTPTVSRLTSGEASRVSRTSKQASASARPLPRVAMIGPLRGQTHHGKSCHRRSRVFG